MKQPKRYYVYAEHYLNEVPLLNEDHPPTVIEPIEVIFASDFDDFIKELIEKLKAAYDLDMMAASGIEPIIDLLEDLKQK